jgi:REP element-mobilizing transposase RayT
MRNRKRKSCDGKKQMVIAYHLIWAAYGYWLPNDPRGSTSRSIACDVIAELGSLHYGRKKVQPSAREVKEFHEHARRVLKHPLLDFEPSDFAIIADGIAEAIHQHNYTCYACAIMPDHVHALIRKHRHQAEDMLENLQQSTRLRLRMAGLRSSDHPTWGGPGWKVFLDTPTDIRRSIRYTDENPPKWRLPRQLWPFVKQYDGWPLHRGNRPHSPYARSLREYKE